MSIVDFIQSKHTNLFSFQLPDCTDHVKVDKPDLLRNMFSQPGQEETLKAYRRYTSIFIIAVLFYLRDNREDDVHSPLFTFSKCAAFISKFKKKIKRYTLRGDNGSDVTSLTMINQLQMVLNGWYVRERTAFETELHCKKFNDHSTYFHVDMEKGKPASKYNLLWKQALDYHTRNTKSVVDSSTVHNAETLKAAARMTHVELWQIIHNRLGKCTPSASRDAAMLSADWTAMARTGDIRQAQYRDVIHGSFSIGSEYNVYSSLTDQER